MKIVKNACFGGFGLSQAAIERMKELTGNYDLDKWLYYENYNGLRSAPELVQVVEEMGKAAGGSFANLVIVEVPDDVKWCIHDYDGIETIEEVHRSW